MRLPVASQTSSIIKILPGILHPAPCQTGSHRTGSASGIGLAIVKHLLSHSYLVVIADLTDSLSTRISSSLPGTKFIKTDIFIYAQQAASFDTAFEWGGNRLDFFAANTVWITDEVDQSHGNKSPIHCRKTRRNRPHPSLRFRKSLRDGKHHGQLQLSNLHHHRHVSTTCS